MEAIVLAGGFGTRLKGVVPDLPKPMAPVAGRPFLEILLDNLKQGGFKRVVLSVGHLAERIIDHFGDRHKGLDIAYAIEDAPLGTGGATRLALRSCRAADIFVFNGDTYLEFDFAAAARERCRNGRGIIVTRAVPDTSRFGRITVEGRRILRFNEKGASGPGLINAGAYILARSELDGFEDGKAFSLETDYLAQAVAAGAFDHFLSEGLFIDIGVPEDYKIAQTALRDFPR